MHIRQPLISAVLAFLLSLSAGGFAGPIPASASSGSGGKHVLLISIDGMHAIDLEKFIATNPQSTLAALANNGVRYTNASASTPSDSFPGLVAIVTGGSPKSTGLYYEVSFDRTLVAPANSGATCTPGGTNTVGTVVDWSEAIDINSNVIDGGGGINPQALPRDPATCNANYPHNFLGVNTMFEVLKANSLHTAWSDKSLGYDIVNGPSGTGVDDLYTPEINAPITVGTNTGTPTSSETYVQAYDSIKVQAIINEIDGFDHTGTTNVGVPAIFGMNFQAVSVGQKLEHDALTGATGGYLDAQADPTPLLTQGLTFVDQQLGRMVAELKAKHIYNQTTIIITAKHGQSPIDPSLLQKLGDPITPIVNGVQANLLANQTADTASLLWLTDSSKTSAVATALQTAGSTIGISSASQVLDGTTLYGQFGNPATLPLQAARQPDVIVTPNLGVLYSTSTKKIADHGGFNHDDTNVALLVSGPGFGAPHGRVVTTAVTTSQVAPTIISLFGLDPNLLQAVQQEQTAVLPSLRG
jgi:hypothetical protein